MSLVLTSSKIKYVFGIDLFEDIYDSEKHYNLEKFRKYQYFKRDDLALNKTKENLNKICNFYKINPKVNLIKGNSYFDSTEEKTSLLLKELKVDLIHIDGDHTREGVSNDFKRYFKYLNKGKYLVFDDYHHKDIKKFVDSITSPEVIKIGTFKAKNTGAIQYLIKKRS